MLANVSPYAISLKKLSRELSRILLLHLLLNFTLSSNSLSLSLSYRPEGFARSATILTIPRAAQCARLLDPSDVVARNVDYALYFGGAAQRLDHLPVYPLPWGV